MIVFCRSDWYSAIGLFWSTKSLNQNLKQLVHIMKVKNVASEVMSRTLSLSL